MDDLVRRTAPLSIPLTGLLCMWLFGNLYESVVWNPQLLADPRPGSLVGTFAAGSPVYYYLPWTPVSIVLAIVLRFRFGGQAPGRVRRTWNVGLAALAVALGVKILLIARVNPVFRDPGLSATAVHNNAVKWAFGNGVAVIGVAVACYAFTAWRRGRATRFSSSTPAP